MSVTIINNDALRALSSMESESVQTCVTSPPYWGLRDYGVVGQIGLEKSPYEYIEKLVSVFRELRRVLKDDDTLWLNIGDTYAANRSYQVPSTKGGEKHSPAQGFEDSGMRVPEGLKQKDLIGIPWRLAFALQADGWYLRSDIIWHKPNAMPESVTDRPTRCHEYVFLLAKSAKYYYDHEAVKEEAVSKHPSGNGFKRPHRLSYADENGARGNEKQWVPTELRNRRDVWSINTKPFKGAHFAVFPEELVEPCILAGSKEGDTVLDPFCGSGTTLAVAERLGRAAVGVEVNKEYIPLVQQRLVPERLAA